MQRKLQDYIHFYIGQEAEVFWTFQGRVESEGIGIIIGIKTLIDLTQEHPITVRKKIGAHSTDTAEYNYAYEDVKPLLRPLSDMTEEEAIALYCSEPWHHVSKSHIKQAVIKENVKGHQPNIIEIHHAGPSGSSGYCTGTDLLYLNKLSALQFAFLLSRGFDLFDLIESGLAMDKTKREGKV